MWVKLLIIAAIVCWLPEIQGAIKKGQDLPPFIKACHRRDPEISKCLIKATETVKPYLVKGIKELGIPPIEPFHLPEVTLEQGTQALNFRAVLNNITVLGLGNYKFTQFDFDVPNLQFFCKATISPIHLAGDYKVSGKILLAPIEGKGDFTASIESSEVVVYQKINPIKKYGDIYLEAPVTNTSISIGGPKVQLNGLFDGTAEINEITNKVIQDNIDELFVEIKPVIEKVITSITEDLLFKSFLNTIPFNRLYPDIP